MSNSQPQPVVAVQQEQSKDDYLVKLLTVDIPREQQRLRQLQNPSVQVLQSELYGTFIDLLKDVIGRLIDVRDLTVNLRDWSYTSMNAISDHLEASDERLDLMEQYNTETTILPEDADLFGKIVVSCKYLVTSLLEGPFPIVERDEDGKAKLAEILELCEQAETVLNDSALEVVDDSEEVEETPENDFGEVTS